MGSTAGIMHFQPRRGEHLCLGRYSRMRAANCRVHRATVPYHHTRTHSSQPTSAYPPLQGKDCPAEAFSHIFSFERSTSKKGPISSKLDEINTKHQRTGNSNRLRKRKYFQVIHPISSPFQDHTTQQRGHLHSCPRRTKHLSQRPTRCPSTPADVCKMANPSSAFDAFSP